MSAQRARSAVTPDHRSAHPNIPGLPWWGAALLAVTLIAIGFAFDAGSGSKELGFAFAAAYALGCILAVLAVRQSGLFTAVIQPPLILFVAVPTSYFLFHGAKFTGVKDTLINFGYPLIERFPLMFFTSAAVLLIGMARWYYGMSSRRNTARSTATEKGAGGRMSSVTSKVSSLLTGGSDESDVEDAKESRRRKQTTERPARPAKSIAGADRSGKAAKRRTPSRSRHVRPPETEIIEAVAERPRRTRAPRRADQPPAEPRRRSRNSSPREPREPREAREPRNAVPPSERRSPYERPERRRRFDDRQPREPHVSNGNGNGTHHPVSRVRYRGSADDSDNRVEYRTRSRSSRRGMEAESWEYDI